MLFPPLSARLRFLIHRAAGRLPELSTFSVGEGPGRQVAVCFSSFRAALEEYTYDSSQVMEVKPRPPPSRACRRPDKAVYVPLALRSARAPSPAPDPPGPAPDNLPSPRVSEESAAPDPGPTPGDPSSSSVSEESSASGPAPGDPPSPAPSDLPSSSISEESDTPGPAPEAEPPDWDQTVSCFSGMSLEEQAEEDQIYHEISSHLKEAPVQLDHAQNDYSHLQDVLIDRGDFAHVIEIYDFPAIFNTHDLCDALSEYSDGGMKIKWVDNTHALAVFSSAAAALRALSLDHPRLKTRALSRGSRKAKGKAVRRAEFLQPVRERPRTDTAVARRMVTRALGLRSKPC